MYPTHRRITWTHFLAATAAAVLLAFAFAVPAAQDAKPLATDAPRREWPVAENWKRLSPDGEVWVDMKKKQVLTGGHICLTRGVLEMFACPQRTKEHESIVAVHSSAQLVHTALLAVGAEPGHPVKYQPQYTPATGTSVDIFVLWLDEQGRERKRPAREMIRTVNTGKPLDKTWVFAGSLMWQDSDTGKQYYQADGGELVCVSNFGTAMLDLPIASSDTNSDLMFDAFTEQIPARDTPVRLLLVPQKKVAEPAEK